ncbi:MAG: hypothetical protein JNJ83_17735 [Verrucomicrobiaceae bacterium]|nr:hypothetical protein [Verrucomicrobiaceae bacterium]
MSRFSFAALLLFTAVVMLAQGQAPVGDKPPTLSLPSLKELPPPPALPVLPKQQPAAAATPKADAAPSTMPTPIPQSPPPSVAARDKLPTPPKPAGSSSGGQFVIHGAELKTRALMLQRCEAVALEMRSLLQDNVEGAIPIIIAIRTAPDLNPSLPAVSPAISALAHGGFHLQLTVQARPDFNPQEMRKELIRLLVVERILRGHQQITPKGRILPDWLLVGINEALDFRSRTRPSALFSAVFRTGKVFGIEEILEAEPGSLDALSRAIYNSSCCALVLTLLDQPDGALSFSKFLRSLPTDARSNRELLAAWFPNLGSSKSSLEKWWSLKLANLARPSVFETLSPEETMTALTSALYFRYEGSSEKPSTSSTPRRKPPSQPPTPEVTAVEETPKSGTGIIRNWFKRDEKPDEESVKETKSEPSPAAPAASDEQVQPKKDDGPGFFGRFFFGDKKEAPESSKDSPKAADKTDDSAFLQLAPSAVWHTASPLLSLLSDHIICIDDKGTPIVRILGIGKKKTPEEIAQEEKEKAEKEAARLKAKEAEAAAKMAADDEKAKARAAEKAKEAEERAQKDAARDKARADRQKEKDDKEAQEDADRKEMEAPPPPPPAPTVRKTSPTPKPKAAQISIPLEEFEKIASRKDLPLICAATARSLAALEKRSHPLFKPVIVRYIEVISAISEGKTKDVPAALAELKVAKEAALSQATAVRTHLDWYEASETKNYTGEFDDYLRLSETIRKELAPRTDVISKHLDEMEEKR